MSNETPETLSDPATVFRVLSAIELAKEKPQYNGDLIEIDSRNTKEIGFIPQEDFGNTLMNLKTKKMITIETFPTEENSHYENHFRIRIVDTKKFFAYFEELKKQHPTLIDPKKDKKIYAYRGLKFQPNNGNFSYGSVKGNFRPYSEPWTILYMLISQKEKDVLISTLQASVINAYVNNKSKKKSKRQDKVAVAEIIKRIRRKLKMGDVKNNVNQNLIFPDWQNKSFHLSKK